MVYVTNRQGKALMPTDRHGKVRRLLKSGLAHVVRRMPFTIQLDYETIIYSKHTKIEVEQLNLDRLWERYKVTKLK